MSKKDSGKIQIGIKICFVTVIERDPIHIKKYKVRCDCGNIKTVFQPALLHALKRSKTYSCGCKRLTEELRRQLGTSRYGKRETELSKKYPEGYGKVKGSYAATLLRGIKKNATKRNISWNIPDLEAFELCTKPCHYCGLKRYLPERNGLDRIDNSKGYSLDNVVTCCKWCNSGKQQRTEEEFKQWIIDLYNNFANNTT
jgi:hypothetical protein